MKSVLGVGVFNSDGQCSPAAAISICLTVVYR
jgi:hypothetical protein